MLPDINGEKQNKTYFLKVIYIICHLLCNTKTSTHLNTSIELTIDVAGKVYTSHMGCVVEKVMYASE